MIQLAKTKKVKRKRNYKKVKRRELPKFKKITKQQYVNFLGPLFILLFVVFGITVVLQKTFFDSTNYVTNFDWSKESIKLYDNPYLYEDVQQTLSGKNIYNINYFGERGVFDNLKKKYPIIDAINLTKVMDNTVAVQFVFKKPEILFQLQERRFGVWDNGILEVFSGNTIMKEIPTIYLPRYASGVQVIDGIFYDISQKKLLQDFQNIRESFPQAEKIVYMPGSQTIVIFVYKKKVYINNAHDIQGQINTFYAMEKYYTEFQNLSMIDLGSLDVGKAIVR